MFEKYFDVAKAYILYRTKHEESRFIKERIDYMNKYSESTDNAASSSETDANANVTQKNVANLESEVYKTTNRIIQRQRMKDKLNELYPEVAKQYEKDLNHHVIYTHDEASTPVLKQYCMAVSLYPLMTEGVGNIDGDQLRTLTEGIGTQTFYRTAHQHFFDLGAIGIPGCGEIFGVVGHGSAAADTQQTFLRQKCPGQFPAAFAGMTSAAARSTMQSIMQTFLTHFLVISYVPFRK